MAEAQDTGDLGVPLPASWWQPPIGPLPLPPVETKPAALPLSELGWPDVERLFLRLLDRVETLDYVKLHGRSGQKQNGIDAFGRLASPLASSRAGRDHVTLQSRRVDRLSAGNIAAAVDEFRSGTWAARTCKFYYATSHSLSDTALDEAIVAASAQLAEDNITFIPWGREQVSEALRTNPDIVDDFFGREWVRVFCGSNAADNLASRLPRADVAKLRSRLSSLYRSIFGAQDMAAPARPPGHLSSGAREFVKVDVVPQAAYEAEAIELADTSYAQPQAPMDEAPDGGEADLYKPGSFGSKGRARARQMHRVRAVPEGFTRMPADEWLTEDPLSLLVGAPGAGKSSLLQFVAINLLSDNPQPAALTQAYGPRLPIWLPFGFLCRHVRESTSHSVLSAVQAWLDGQDAGDLWALVSKSLDDSRLLLIVDGLDEWPDVPHAEDALALVETFLNARREAAAIVSCRPYALSRLPLTLPWHRAYLAPLTHDQQRRIAQQALLRERPEDDVQGRDLAFLQRKAASQAENLLAEIWGVPQLGELARVPLFLVLLASVWQGEPLPPRRFDVYRRLVELLLLKHPQMRRRASRGVRPSTAISPESAELVFAAVAYALRCDDVTGVTVRPSLRRIIVRALRDDTILGYDETTAQGIADQVLALGEEEIGLLVSHGAGRVGFLHRVVFEQLAGEHLGTLALDEQIEIIMRVSGDPGWRDVILAMLVSLRRPTDVHALLEAAIDAWPEDSAGAMSAWELLAEAISAGVRITPSDLGAYLAKLEERVENHPWIDHRARLLSSLTVALLMPQIDERLRPTFKRWMRAPLSTPTSAVWALRKLSLEPHNLWRRLRWGLQHPEGQVQINAALAIAVRAGDLDQHVPELVALITRASSTSTQAAALYALVRGWPDHPRLAEFVTWARAQRSFALRVVAFQATMGIDQEPNSANLSDGEKAWLLSLLDADHLDQDPWTGIANDLVRSVAQGNAQIADTCLNTLMTNDTNHNRNLSWYLACTAFSEDPRFRDWASDEFEKSDFPLVLYSKALIPDAWRSDQRFTAAVTSYLKRHESKALPQDAYQLSRLAVCSDTRDELIGELDSSWPWRFARALMRDYPDDPDVHAALVERLHRGGDQASRLAPVAVEALGLETALPLLVELVDGSKTSSAPYAANALATAWRTCEAAQAGRSDTDTATHIEPEIARTLLAQYDATMLAERCLNASEAASWEGASDEIVLAWPTDPNVLGHARGLLEGENPRLATVLLAYDGRQGDAARELTGSALGLLSSLEAELREVVATVLQRPEFHPLLVDDVLGDWLYDHDASVRRLSVIALATALHPQQETSKSFTDASVVNQRRASFKNTVRQQLLAYGPELELRRQAAWIAMLMLGDLHLIDGLVETIGEPTPVCVSLQYVVGPPDPVLAELVARQWSRLQEHFGAELPRRLSGRQSDHVSPWGALATVADRHTSVADAIRAVLAEEPELAADPRIVMWIARKDPDVAALEMCISTLQNHHTNDVPSVMNLMINTPWQMPREEIEQRLAAAGGPKGTSPSAALDEDWLRPARARWFVPLFTQWFPAHALTSRLYQELNDDFRHRRAAGNWMWEDVIAVALMGAPAVDFPLLLLRIHGAIIARDAYLYRPLFVTAARRRLRADDEVAHAVQLQASSRDFDARQHAECHVFAGAEGRLTTQRSGGRGRVARLLL